MPLPLLFFGVAAATGIFGVGKTLKAGIDNSDAKDINESAQKRINDTTEKLNKARKSCGESLKRLGEEKIYILNNSINEFIASFEKIKDVEFTKSQGLTELNKIHIDKKSYAELKQMGGVAASFAGGATAGVAGGTLAAFGAYGAASTFATASTGTAIASLSGAAASNATLAFFGGGSLAAGGLGMAGGTAVLGGLVTGPALLVMGLITGAKASANLDNAYANSAKADEICEQLMTAIVQCNAIRRRTYMFYNLLARLDSYFLPLVYKMEEIIAKEGTDYFTYSSESKKTIASAASIAGTIKAILDTALLTEDGSLTDESEKVAKDIYISMDEGNED